MGWADSWELVGVERTHVCYASHCDGMTPVKSTAATASTAVGMQAACSNVNTGPAISQGTKGSEPCISFLTCSFILWWGGRNALPSVHLTHLHCPALWWPLSVAGCRSKSFLWLFSPSFPSLWIFLYQINHRYYFFFPSHLNRLLLRPFLSVNKLNILWLGPWKTLAGSETRSSHPSMRFFWAAAQISLWLC